MEIASMDIEVHPDKFTGMIEIDPKKIRLIARLTAGNQHGEAYQMAARALGLTEIAATFDRIEGQRRRAGYIDDLYEERRGVYNEMLKYARAHMNEADYQRFYMAL